MDTSELYWLPFKAVYQQLQAANRSTLSVLGEQLNLNFQWLLDGLNKFQTPNEKSLSALKAGKSLKASAWGPKRGIAVDKHLVSATVELGQLLDLDQLQCHLLLKRWLKDNDINIPPPAAAPATAGTSAFNAIAPAPLALPATGGASASASTPATTTLSQAVLSADMVQGVADFYAQERIYLTKCQQFIVMTAMQVTTDASQTCRDVLKRLLDAGWETKTFDSLAALLTPKQQTGSNATLALPAPQTAAGSNMAHLVKPSDFEQRLHLHNLHERCELLCILSQLYCGPDPTCSPNNHAMQQLLKQHEQQQQQEMLTQQEADEAAAAAAAVAEVAGLSWPECSEERLLKLLQLLGNAVFLQGAQNGHNTVARKAAGAANNTTYGQASSVQQLAEALASSVILAALKPGKLLDRLAEAAGSAAAGGPLPRNTTQFKQWRSIEAALMQWRAVPGSVLAMLAVFAYNQLLASYRGAADSISPSIQNNALQAGGFAAIAAPLSLEELAPNSLAGALHRGLLLQGISLMASAFDLSPLLLPGDILQQLVTTVVHAVKGCPHLTQQIWDDSNITFKPIRYLLDEACSLFPAFPGPFLQLATGLAQGQESAAACYCYLCNKPCLAVEYQTGTHGVILQGDEAVLEVDVPWAKAPEVEGSIVPQGSRGRLLEVPEFARPPATSEGGTQPPASFLVAWEVDAEQGTGPVLLLARAAHCLQQLHVADAGRQAVAATEYWQDLRIILQLVAALLKADPLLAKPLLSVTIIYNSNQQMDWLDVLVASLNMLPSLAATAGGSSLSGRPMVATSSTNQTSTHFCKDTLTSLADCLVAAAAVAGCQPGRVMGALGSCQLFAGVGLAAEPLGLVALEDLSGWAQGQQEAGGSGLAGDWGDLTTLQALQEAFEVPHSSYPLTRAVMHLVQTLLNQHCTWGLVPSLVHYTLNRVLGAMPWLPFSSTSDRWSLAAAAFGVVRSAILSGAVATPGAAGPKAAGAPGGIMVTVLGARVIHHLATAGHGYLSSVLPPPADTLQDMAEQQAGSSGLLAAGTELAEQLLLLVSVLLPAVAHLSPEMPLQQYWATNPPGGGLSPAAIIGSYATYPHATHLPLLALEALNAFAILQTGTAATSFGNPIPSAGGPPVPVGVSAAAGLGPVGGPVQQGLNPVQPYLRGVHVATAAGMGVGGRGGAGGWWRPSGLFACLFAAIPSLRTALLRPFELSFAQEYPEWTIRTMALLEAGIRHHPEVLDSLCFPSALTLPQDKSDTAAAAASDTSKTAANSGKPAADKPKTPSALDGLWQMLKQAPELMKSQPKLLAAGMRLLSTLWECQGSAHGAVELLRSQPGFWNSLKGCCPVSGALPTVAVDADPSEAEAAAWTLQIHTCALHVLLLELLSVQVARGAGSTGPSSSSSSHEALLAAFGPLDVCQLLVAASDLGVQHDLLDQLARMLQVTYLQLGASAVTGAWGPSTLKTNSLSVAVQFRQEVQPLLDAAAAGEYSLEDLKVACDILADPDNAQEALAAAATRGKQLADEDETMEGGLEDANGLAAAGDGQRGRVLVDALTSRPFGELLLSFSAVTPGSWAAGETGYGRHFLFDSARLCQLLGPFILEKSEGAIALAVTLDDVSASAAVAHARLSLLQAATSLFAAQSRHAAARQQLMSADVCKSLLGGSMQGVEKAMTEAIRLSSSPAARLLALPWGLPFMGHASSTALLLASRSLLLSVRFWKVAACSVSPSAAATGGAQTQNTGRPVLMARALNEQDLGFAAAGGSKQQQQQGLAADDTEVISVAAKCAQLLGQWLRGKGGESLAAAAAANHGISETDLEIIGCLSTSLLLLLQALPGQRSRLAGAAVGRAMDTASPGSSKGPAPVSNRESNNVTPAELLELETALLDLLPALCNACAVAVEQQQQQQQQKDTGGLDSAQQAHTSAMLQLLIEILQHQLQPSLWLGAVSQNLALAPLLAAAAARAGSSVDPAGSSAAAAAAVTDISLLELTTAVVQIPEGALQLWQQGLLDVVLGLCRQLLHTGHNTGLLDIASLGLVGPSVGVYTSAAAAAAGFSKLDLQAQWGVSLSTLGAYASMGSSSSNVQTIAGVPSAVAAAGSNAAAGGCIWSPNHQQWCQLLGLLSTLLQQLSKSTEVEDLAMQVLVTTEPRLMLALQSLCTAAGQQQQQHVSAAAAAAAAAAGHAHAVLSIAWGPKTEFEGIPIDSSSGLGRDQQTPMLLTLANLLEAERVLFLLGYMVPHIGVWQLQRPGSLAAFRSAAARLVEFVASPSLDRSLRVSCSPLSPFERRLSKLHSGLEASDGWFKICSAGGANNLTTSAAAAAAAAAGGSAAAAGGSTALVISTGPASPRVGSSPKAAGPAVTGSSSSSGSLLGSTGVGGCSEFCARLCEAMYTACEHSLQFLLATAPVVEAGEVAAAAAAGGGGDGLGPMWPSAKALSALQDQVLAVGTSMVQYPQSITVRRRRIAAACVRIAVAAGQLLEAVAPVSLAGGRSRAGFDAADVARRREKIVQLQRGIRQQA